MKYIIVIILIGLFIEIIGFGTALVTNNFCGTLWITNIGLVIGLSGFLVLLLIGIYKTLITNK